MSKYDYLHALYQALVTLDVTTRNSIMRKVEDRFRQAEETGLSEIDITNELGTPTAYASTFLQPILPEKEIDNVLNDSKELNNRIKPNTEHITVGDVELQIVHTAEPKELLIPQKVATLLSDIEKQNQAIVQVTPTIEETKNTITYSKTNSLPTVNTSSISPQRTLTKKTNSPLVIILTALGLGLFNLTFILGPFIGLWSLIFAFVTTGIALTFSGLLVIVSGAFSFPLSFISVPLIVMGHPVLLFALGFLIIGIGGLLTISMIYCIRFFGVLTGKYVHWNIKAIRGY